MENEQIVAKLVELDGQCKRLVSDAESEKDNRRDIHADFERRLRTLEQFHNKAFGALIIIQIIVTALITYILKH